MCSQYPDETLVQLRVGGLQVVELDGFAQQLFVEGQRETPVDVVTMENCKAHHTTHKVEIWQVVLKVGNTKRQSESERGPLHSPAMKGFMCLCELTGLMEESGLICSV